jgi:hypothetical protein
MALQQTANYSVLIFAIKHSSQENFEWATHTHKPESKTAVVAVKQLAGIASPATTESKSLPIAQ